MKIFRRLLKFFRRPLEYLTFVRLNRLYAGEHKGGLHGYFEAQMQLGFPVEHARFKLVHGYKLNLNTPRSFSEKLVHRKLFDRNPIWSVVTDKVAVREWLMTRGLDSVVKFIPVEKFFFDPSEVRMIQLDRPLVIKAAWASGYNIFLPDPSLDFASIEARLRDWVNTPYRIERIIWASCDIPKRFIVEEKMQDSDGLVPRDYKCFTFHGRVEFIQVDYGRFTSHRRTLYSREGELLNFSFTAYRDDRRKLDLSRANLEKIIAAAEGIGAYFEFVRVDLYLVNGMVYFGEITQTPSNGFGELTSREADFRLGSIWKYCY